MYDKYGKWKPEQTTLTDYGALDLDWWDELRERIRKENIHQLSLQKF